MAGEDGRRLSPQQQDKKKAEEELDDREIVEMMMELSEENEKIVAESPVKKKQKIEREERSPGYTTEETWKMGEVAAEEQRSEGRAA